MTDYAYYVTKFLSQCQKEILKLLSIPTKIQVGQFKSGICIPLWKLNPNEGKGLCGEASFLDCEHFNVPDWGK